MSRLRVIDAGQVNAFRSQALWHGIADAMTPTTDSTLSLCRPAAAYVGLGYHRSLDELDLVACERLGLPVIRRRIGGGPVYIDSDQLFFQLTVPAERAPLRVDRLYSRHLEPAVRAFRTLGLRARIRGLNDISVEDRRLSGTGAGRIGDGVTVVGNVIFRFPHARMARVLALPVESARTECQRLMKEHVTSLEAEGLGRLTADNARRALIDAYAHELGLTPMSDELCAAESAAVEAWKRRMKTPAWLQGPGVSPTARLGRQIKITADVWFYGANQDELRVEASFRTGRLERLRVSSPRLNGAAEEISRCLSGCPIGELERRLAPFGQTGDRVLAVLEPGATLR